MRNMVVLYPMETPDYTEEPENDPAIIAAARAARVNVHKYLHGRCEDAPCCGCCGGEPEYLNEWDDSGWD